MLVENPQAAKSDEIINMLDERYDPMPDYMKEEIESGRGVVSGREQIEAVYDAWQQKKEWLFGRIVNACLSDTLNANSPNNLQNYLQSKNTPQAGFCSLILLKMKSIVYKIYWLILFLPAFGNAQNVWKKCDYIYPNKLLSSDIVETYDKGYLFGGSTRTYNQGYKGIIIKTDINGNKLWHKYIDTYMYLYTTNSTRDGGYIVGGEYLNNNRYDAFIIKFNTCGDVEWCTTLPDSKGNESLIDRTIQQFPNGDYAVLRYIYTYEPVYRWSIARLDPLGNIVWWNNYITNNHDWPFQSQIDWRMVSTNDSGVIVSGLVSDTVDFQQPSYSDFPHWYKVDIEGNLVWERKWDISRDRNPGQGRKVTEDAKGQYYGGGFLFSNPQPFAFKMAHNGDTLQSYKVIDHPNAVGGIVKTINWLQENRLVVGTQFGILPDDNWWGLSLCDTLFNVINRKFEEERLIFGQSLITFDSKILINCIALSTGSFPDEWTCLYKFNINLEYDSIYTAPRTYDSLCPHPIENDTISMPGNCRVVTALPVPVGTGDMLVLKIYPNPATTFISVEIPEYSLKTTKSNTTTQQQFRPLIGEVQLSLMNLSGQIVKTDIFDASERNHVVNVSKLPAGMYMLHLTQKGKFVAKGKAMVVR